MRRYPAACLALTAAVSFSAAAEQAFTARDTDIFAGPSSEFPQIAKLPPNTAVNVAGCLRDYDWCDVFFSNDRGWVYGGDLALPFEGSRVAIIEIGGRMHVPVVGFSLNTYWDEHYRSRPFYREREQWVSRVHIDASHGGRAPAGHEEAARAGSPTQPSSAQSQQDLSRTQAQSQQGQPQPQQAQPQRQGQAESQPGRPESGRTILQAPGADQARAASEAEKARSSYGTSASREARQPEGQQPESQTKPSESATGSRSGYSVPPSQSQSQSQRAPEQAQQQSQSTERRMQPMTGRESGAKSESERQAQQSSKSESSPSNRASQPEKRDTDREKRDTDRAKGSPERQPEQQ